MNRICKIAILLTVFLHPLIVFAYRDRPADLDDYCPGPFEGVSGFIMLVILIVIGVGTVLYYVIEFIKGIMGD